MAICGHLEVVKLLLEKGLESLVQHMYRWTALYHAEINELLLLLEKVTRVTAANMGTVDTTLRWEMIVEVIRLSSDPSLSMV